MRNTVIFDLDGTLLDTLDDLTASVNYCMEKYRQPTHSREQVRRMVGNGIYVLMERALPGGRNNPYYERCMDDFSCYYKKHMLDHTRPFDGVMELLRDLRDDGYCLAIVSNKFDAAVKGLNQHFFENLISVAIGEAEAMGVRKKPAPDTVFAAMREMNVSPQQCVYVGDSEVDIETANNAGIPCISVTWGFKSLEFLQNNGASVLVNTLNELEESIKKY